MALTLALPALRLVATCISEVVVKATTGKTFRSRQPQHLPGAPHQLASAPRAAADRDPLALVRTHHRCPSGKSAVTTGPAQHRMFRHSLNQRN
ncbi:hypothetical protein B0H19DRAFT_1088571 [Mycena capillaripes]|nr:hypothetical protein B0H19DRAFT_1088571 [Mycena capillaripes]